MRIEWHWREWRWGRHRQPSQLARSSKPAVKRPGAAAAFRLTVEAWYPVIGLGPIWLVFYRAERPVRRRRQVAGVE